MAEPKYPHEMTPQERLEQIAMRKIAAMPDGLGKLWIATHIKDLAALPGDEHWQEAVNTLREIADYIESGKIPLEHHPTGRIED